MRRIMFTFFCKSFSIQDFVAQTSIYFQNADLTGANFEEVVAAFMRCLSERRVTETMRRTMSALAVEIARGWRDEFSRSVSLKLNAFFLAAHCEALSAYLRDGLLELDVDEIRLTIPEPSERPAERAELLKVESAALAADKEKLRRLAPLLRPLKR